MKEINPDELNGFNGKEGRPACIAYKGKVYDVTNSKLWPGGKHMMRHQAGKDLTTEIQAAPHGIDVLERYPQVGILKKDTVPARKMPETLSRLLMRFPILKRHPHPMTVHFPIVFMFSATIFALFYILTGIESFESTALHTLGGGLLFTPLAMATGYFTWWLNYLGRPMLAVTIKLRCSLALFALEIIAFTWRLLVPDILTSFRPASIFYLLLLCSFVPLVSVIGWFGATLTFPVEREH